MKNSFLILLCSFVLFSCKEKSTKDDSTQEEWTVLFDGSSLEHWKGYLTDEVSPQWKIEDNAMVFYPLADKSIWSKHNIVTKKNYTSFVLSLEWKISEGGNSGIFFGVQEDPNYTYPYETGLEIQVLDNERHADAKAGLNHQAGALYDLVEPVKDVTKPAGEWNTCVITVNHKTNQGNAVLNGVKVVEFPVSPASIEEMEKNSVYHDWKGHANIANGKIGLQDHGDKVYYRNIKIREL